MNKTNEAINIATTRGFIAEFNRNLKQYPTRKAAFMATNKKYNSYFGEDRYTNYDSFRNSVKIKN